MLEMYTLEPLKRKDRHVLSDDLCKSFSKGKKIDNIRTTYWSPATVQKEIKAMISTPAFKNSPHSAYLEVYQRMTAARDKARFSIGNPMYPTTPLNKKLNDALSDLMTRNYLAIVESAVTHPDNKISPSLDLGGSFKNLHSLAEKNNWDSVRIALGSTGLYLTNHITLALSTLPHLDELWETTPYKDINSRVMAMKQFKPTYDAFNKFLANNLVTVAQSLNEAKLTKNNSLKNVTKLAQPLPWELLFGSVRDNGFYLGLKIAAHTPKGQHPWTVTDNNGFVKMANRVVTMPEFPENNDLHHDLHNLKSFSTNAVSYSTNNIWSNLGGKRFRENSDAKAKLL